jgi:hypothetical protein
LFSTDATNTEKKRKIDPKIPPLPQTMEQKLYYGLMRLPSSSTPPTSTRPSSVTVLILHLQCPLYMNPLRPVNPSDTPNMMVFPWAPFHDIPMTLLINKSTLRLKDNSSSTDFTTSTPNGYRPILP